MPKNNSPERRALRRTEAQTRANNVHPLPLIKGCPSCGKTHRAGWFGCLPVTA